MKRQSAVPRSRKARTMTSRLLVCSGLVVLASCALLPAQNVVLTGALSGRVTDQSGAVVPAASVVMRNLSTGVEQTAQTNNVGLYGFPTVMPGTYSLSASSKGFRGVEISLVRVQVGNTTTQDISLQVGASGDTVKVSGVTPLMRPTESSTSTVLERSFTQDLPLNGRRYTDFTTLSPNTSYDGDTGLVSIAGQQGGEDS